MTAQFTYMDICLLHTGLGSLFDFYCYLMQDSYQPEGESESDESIESEEDNEIGDDESDNVEDDVHVLDEKPTDSPKEVCEEFLFIKI